MKVDEEQWTLVIRPHGHWLGLRLGQLWQYRDFIAAPVTPVIEAFRFAFLGAGDVNAGHLLYSAGVTLAVLFLGTVLFTRVERTFMDTV